MGSPAAVGDADDGVPTATVKTSVVAPNQTSAAEAIAAAAVVVPSSDSSGQGAPQVETTPRDRAAQAGGDGKSGEGVGGGGGASSWKTGDLVVLKARVSKGINKLGGVARVLEVFEEDDTYLVKLSMGELWSLFLSGVLVLCWSDESGALCWVGRPEVCCCDDGRSSVDRVCREERVKSRLLRFLG